MNAKRNYRNETKTQSKQRMKPTVSGTDDQEYRHVSQPSTSSEAKFDVCPVTTPARHIIYTTAQLHENFKEGDVLFYFSCIEYDILITLPSIHKEGQLVILLNQLCQPGGWLPLVLHQDQDQICHYY